MNLCTDQVLSAGSNVEFISAAGITMREPEGAVITFICLLMRVTCRVEEISDVHKIMQSTVGTFRLCYGVTQMVTHKIILFKDY